MPSGLKCRSILSTQISNSKQQIKRCKQKSSKMAINSHRRGIQNLVFPGRLFLLMKRGVGISGLDNANQITVNWMLPKVICFKSLEFFSRNWARIFNDSIRTSKPSSVFTFTLNFFCSVKETIWYFQEWLRSFCQNLSSSNRRKSGLSCAFHENVPRNRRWSAQL